MDFLKDLFGTEALTFEQLKAKVEEKKFNVVNLAEGNYVSKTKFDDRVNDLNQQVTDLRGQLTKRDTDIADLNTKLTAAQADATKLADVQNTLNTLRGQYDNDKKDWDAKIAKQKYEFLVRDKAGSVKFTSAAAKRDFIAQATAKDFKIDGETLLGYEDFLTKYKAENPGALVEDKPDDGQNNDGGQNGDNNGGNNNPPSIVASKTQNGANNGSKAASAFDFNFAGVRKRPTTE